MKILIGIKLNIKIFDLDFGVKRDLNMPFFQALPQIILKRFRLVGAVAETFSRSLLTIPLSGKNTRKQIHTIHLQ